MPAKSHRCIFPRTVIYAGRFPQGLNSSYSRPGLCTTISHHCGERKVGWRLTQTTRIQISYIISHTTRCMFPAKTYAYTVGQLHNQAHKRPLGAINIGKEHIMTHKQLFARSDLITIGRTRSPMLEWLVSIAPQISDFQTGRLVQVGNSCWR